MKTPKRAFWCLLAVLACFCSSCSTTPDEEKRPQRRLANPGDELDVKPWGRGTRSSHFGTPFGLPTSN